MVGVGGVGVSSTVAPFAMVRTPDGMESPAAEFNVRDPLITFVPPVYELLPVRITLPEKFTAPDPEIDD